jgi:hypothetical protein
MDSHHAPHDAHIPIRIPAIKLVLVVQIDGMFDRLLNILAPLQNFLGPVHSHESVHLTQVHHLLLCRIPEIIVSFGFLQLLPVAMTRFMLDRPAVHTYEVGFLSQMWKEVELEEDASVADSTGKCTM